MDRTDSRSILSHEERELAGELRSNPDLTVTEAGDRCGMDAGTAERADERVREKTDRALATLVQSPYLAETVADLDTEARDRLRAAFDDR
jgi:hypothetical protein